MKRTSLVFAILIGLSSLRMSCLFNKNSPLNTDSTTTVVHQTKIVGALTGDYAADEVVTFSIDGVSIGDATGSGTVSEIVTPNVNHTIVATSKNVPSTFTNVLNLQPGQVTNYNFPCKPAKVTIVTDAALALSGVTKIRIFELSGPGAVQLDSLVPGEQGVINVEPQAGAMSFVAADQNGNRISSVSQKLTWDCSFTWTVTK